MTRSSDQGRRAKSPPLYGAVILSEGRAKSPPLYGAVILSEAKDLPVCNGEDPSPSSRTPRPLGRRPKRPPLHWLVLAIALWVAMPVCALPLSDYVASLERVRASLAANQLDAAKAEAAKLKGAVVEWEGGKFAADETLLAEVAAVKRAELRLLTRLEITIDELRRSGGNEGTRANHKMLQQVAAEQHVPELAPGGEIDTKIDAEAPLLARIGESLAAMRRWLGEQIGKFIDWFIDLFPGEEREEAGATAGMRWLVIAVTALIALVIALLAFEVVRRAKRREVAAVESAAPVGSKRDEDPLSRGATEWERYAASLAAEGRYREAIRAWYHAVLVTCWAAGVLHFRKGRTNWEYLSMLAPSVAWRGEMIELTRRFEKEWYGHAQSTADALADCSERAQTILETLRRRGAA